MNKHFLALRIPDVYNPKILVINDESIYSDALPIDCGTITIYVPGFNNPLFIEVDPEFNMKFSACSLGIQRFKCNDFQADLPDGVYSIQYTVSPSDKVYVEYYHLRTTLVTNKLNKARGKVLLEPCSPGDEIIEALAELRLIEDFIKAAKVQVEDHHEAEEGMALLIYADKRLNKFLDKDC